MCSVEPAEDIHPERNPVVRLLARVLPLDVGHRGPQFVCRRGNRHVFSLLFLALVTVEVSDVMFAIDSIPTVFAVTRDPFIVFTSNIFAILGLRSLYFVLAGILERFRYLRFGLAGVLLFVGGKMVLSGIVHVQIGLSLVVVAALLLVSIVVSVAWPAEMSPGSLNRQELPNGGTLPRQGVEDEERHGG
jgi:tellurite resistance protein TerC